jgi:hypothetical protein
MGVDVLFDPNPVRLMMMPYSNEYTVPIISKNKGENS